LGDGNLRRKKLKVKSEKLKERARNKHLIGLKLMRCFLFCFVNRLRR